MLAFNVGKREHNKVLQKIAILDTFLSAMSHQKLHELNIEDECKKIGISKVTFFNYFSSKEEVVEYFIQLWQFEMSYEISKRQLKGKEILYYLLENVSEHPAAHSIMSALTAFFIKVDCYIPTEVSEYELYIYNEEAYLKGFSSIPLYNLIKDAVDEIGISGQDQSILITNFMSGFYGIPLVYGLGFNTDLKVMYTDYLDNILPKEVNDEKSNK